MSGADVVERALALSRADGCIVVVSEHDGVHLRWAGSTMTTNGAARGRSVAVASVVGERVGVRSATSDDDLEQLVRASETAAKEGEPALDAGPLVEGGADAGFEAPAQSSSPQVLSRLAADLGAAFASGRPDRIRHYGFASHEITTSWLGSSTGLRLRHAQPTGFVELTAKNDTPGGSAMLGRHTRDFTDVAVPELADELRRRLGWARRQVELLAGRYETLLPPSAVADLMIYAYWTASGRDAAEGRTAFSRPGGATRVGEQIGPPELRLRSDPQDAALAVQPFADATASSSMTSVFDAGLALPATDWISDGRLAALVQTRASARETGAPVTPYVHNLVLDGGSSASTAEMVTATGRGVLLTSLWYIRMVDPQTLLLTGLTRDGVYLVEDGQVTGAVNNFRWNESPLDLLGRVTEVGASAPCLPREWSDDFSWTRMPTLRVPDFLMSSVSPAW